MTEAAAAAAMETSWNTASTHRSAFARATHRLDIVGYSVRTALGVRNSVRSGAFQAGGNTWALVCCFERKKLGSISLELLSSQDDPREVVAMAGLRIDNPTGTGRWPPAVWHSHEAHTFPKFGLRTWELSVPNAFQEARYVHDDRFSVTCTVDILEDSAPAETMNRFLVSALPPPSISTDLHGLLSEGTRSPPDVTFVVEGDKIQAHKLVLSMRSPVFEAQFHGSKRLMRTVRIDDMSAATFRAMLRFIYTDEMPIKPKGVASQDECRNKQVARRRAAMARDLLVAADRYDIERLRLMCESILSESIDATTVMSTLLLVEGRYRCRLLEASCIAYMASDPDTFAAVVATPENQELRERRVSFIAGIAEKVALHNKQDGNCPGSSSASSLRPKKTSSTFMSLERGTHEFMIPNFSSVLRRLHADQEIHSGRFHVGGYDWRIMCRKGEFKEHKEHLSVYLYLLTDPGTDNVEVMATFYIADPNHKSPPISTRLEQAFSQKNMAWGFADFITLASAKSQYVGHDGSFTITCHIDVNKHESCSSSSTSVGVASGVTIPVPPSNIAWHLEQLLVSEQGADVMFLVEGTTVVHAHKLFLAARSPVLYEVATSVASMDSQVRIDGIKAAVFKAVLHFIYTDELPSSGALRDDMGMAGDMLAAAGRYHLERLKAVCQNILAESISTENALNMLKIADQLRCQELKDYCMDYVSSSPHVVKEVMTKSFSSFVCN
ncbi:unnamed protein product [Urochloa humidicola]